MLKKVALVLLFALFASAAAMAFDGYVDITNNTGYTIYYIYVSHHTSDDWEEDVLDDEVLLDGDTIRITLEGYSDSIFDIMVEDEDGDTYTFWDIDVEVDDIEVTLADLDIE
ncbi:MAG: hypothetical protein KKI09_06350 [Spirochaetes bacterium]|nr:hypothetical protein [Spirochaetota bacterium]MBU0955032.1 hypothetical protein [Spirochaetota bacterium]